MEYWSSESAPMPSSDSMFGMDDESCFLCGGTVFAYESTAASAMVGYESDMCVFDYGRCRNKARGDTRWDDEKT